MNTTLEELAWLHDCAVESVQFDMGEDRAVSVQFTCPRDLGYEPWNGRTLVLVAHDVRIANHWSWSSGPHDSINRVVPCSAEFERLIRDTEAAMPGLRLPDVRFTIVFASGSKLDLACSGIEVVEPS